MQVSPAGANRQGRVSSQVTQGTKEKAQFLARPPPQAQSRSSGLKLHLSSWDNGAPSPYQTSAGTPVPL